MRSILNVCRAALSAVLTVLWASPGTAQSLTVPLGFAAVEGSTGNAFPWNRNSPNPLRVQVIYDSANFPIGGPILINRLRWRANGSTQVWTGGSLANCTVSLSTAAVDYSSPSSTFTSNHGADVTQVYSGVVTFLPGTGNGSGVPGPTVVDLAVAPFVYDPTLGDLVIDCTVPGSAWSGGTATALDVQGTTPSPRASRVFNSSTTAPTGTITLDHGLVVTVDYTPVGIVHFGFRNVPLGNATLTALGNGNLLIGGIGSSGNDGVRILEVGDGVIAQLAPIDPAGMAPVGAYLRIGALGEMNGVANVDLGHVTATKIATGVTQFTADYSSVGATMYVLEIYNQGILQMSRTSPAVLTPLMTWSGAAMSQFPRECGKRDGWPSGLPGRELPCIVVAPPLGTITDVATAQVYTGDEIRVLAITPTPLTRLLALQLLGSQLPDITLTNEIRLVRGTVTTFGVGCAGTGGVPVHTVRGTPMPGASLEFSITNIPPLSLAVHALGFSNTIGFGGPLPLNLAFLGMNGCTQWSSWDGLVWVLGDPSGTAASNLTLPNSVTLAGLRFFSQGGAVDASANILGVTTTNALDLTIGR